MDEVFARFGAQSRDKYVVTALTYLRQSVSSTKSNQLLTFRTSGFIKVYEDQVNRYVLFNILLII